MSVYEGWVGTPRAMGGKVDGKGRPAPLVVGSLAEVKRRLREHLATLKKQAHRFDLIAERSIAEIDEQIRAVTDGSIQPGDHRSWQWDHISIISRIEIRRRNA